MSNEITIQKTTLLLILAILVVLSAGLYVFLTGSGGAQGSPQTGSVDSAGGGTAVASVQDVYLTALGTGKYDKSSITVKKGIPVLFHFTAETSAGCGKQVIMEDFNVKLVSKNGETVTAEFTPQQEGTYYYHCGMWMFKGKLIVVS